jgi:hypothetical protein
MFLLWPLVYDNILYHIVLNGQDMRFSFPRFPAEFEIPDEWWSESGMDGFTPSNRGYRSTATATLVPLRDIEPPFRSLECPLDFCGFDRERLISVLKGIATGAEIDPVPLRELPPVDAFFRLPHLYQVRDGFHRFYGSVAAGFECLSVEIS